MKAVLISANSADPYEMQHYAAFHLGLRCLSNTCLGVSSLQRVDLETSKSQMDLVARKPIFKVCGQVMFNLACSATYTS